MILETIQIPELINKLSTDGGMDTIKYCINRSHYVNFPYDVSYSYNSRGFRDIEWPSLDELKNAIWCLGDSFTVGIGSPWTHTWPQVLTQATKKRVINVSMDGASNDWIVRKCLEIYDEIKPSNIVIMWSYLHRRENKDSALCDRDRRLHYSKATIDEDVENLLQSVNLLINHCEKSNIIQTIIPCWDFHHVLVEPSDQNKIKEKYTSVNSLVHTVTQTDFARDGHHFDIKTSSEVVNFIVPLLK